MQKPNLLIVGPFFSLSGYGAHSRDILEALWTCDKFNIYTIPTRWGTTTNSIQFSSKVLSILKYSCRNAIPNGERYIHMHIGLPTEFSGNGTLNVGVTAGLEADRFPQTWATAIEKQDLVIVPSTFMQSQFKAINSNVTVKAIGEGVDIKKFYPRQKDEQEVIDLSFVKEEFCFLIHGQWLPGNIGEDRKQIGLAITLFNEVFASYSNVGLIVKTSQINHSSPDSVFTQSLIKSLVLNNKRKGNVYLLHGVLSDEELRGLYIHDKVKGFYTCTSGEGWYRPMAEAIACDLPILSPAWSGYMDYLDTKYTTIFEHAFQEVSPVNFRPGLFERGMLWGKVDPDSVKAQLLNFYNNYNDKKQLAIQYGERFRDSKFVKVKTDKLLVDTMLNLSKRLSVVSMTSQIIGEADVKQY